MNLDNLNEAQKDAVLHTDGPMMILAGAGSGKTRTLVTKIEYLISEKNIGAYNILAMTFSNRAAREMQERIQSSLGEKFGSLFITTFHSFCSRVLRSEANYIGLSRNFTIYDDSESLSVIKNIMGRRGLSQKEINPKEIKFYIGQLKNLGYFPGCEAFELFEHLGGDIDKDDLFYEIYQEYERELHTSNAVDFGGLICGTIELFCKHESIVERYHNRFKYLLIDEYQDTNRAQFFLIRLLSSNNSNVCVVGDEDQSIYSWRGADINNILDFESFYQDVSIFKLEQNYRSTKNIIEAASYVINKNKYRKGKKLWTENSEGEEIEIIECMDDTTEAKFITEKVKDLVRNNTSLTEMAIFYRNNSQSRMIEDALRKNQIPYKIVGGIKFYDRKEVKDAISYMKVVNNGKDSLSLSRIINSPPRGVGAVTLRKIETEALKVEVSLYEMMKMVVEEYETYSHLRLSTRIRSSLRELVDIIEEVRLMDRNEDPPSFCLEKLLEDSGYFGTLRASKNYENLARLENLKELINGVKQYEYLTTQEGGTPSIAHFLETITLDQKIDAEEGVDQDQLALMTVHSSKGLEYDHVFLVGAEENLFPSIMSLEEGEERLEEERRLFYVAMTRAMKKLYISFCKSRLLWGRVQFQDPSRFVFEIPEEFINWQHIGKKGRSGIKKKTSPEGVHVDYSDEFSQVDDDPFDASENTYYNPSDSYELESSYQSGQIVKHGLYGEGMVVKTEGHGTDEKVTIKFKQGAIKKFLIKYAPLEVLG